MNLLHHAEVLRNDYLRDVLKDHQEEFSQYFTPIEVAEIMASFVSLPESGVVKVLDPGAGTGILMAALVERAKEVNPNLQIEITAIEKDPELIPVLQKTLENLSEFGHSYEIINEDFLEWAVATQWKTENKTFDVVLQNPPYKKLSASSDSNHLLKSIGIFVPNLYAAFLSLGQVLLSEAGQQISITPRSWMNGAYYKKFRKDFLSAGSLTHIHTFESRSKVFGDTGVLQESVIVRNIKSEAPDKIEVSISEDQTAEASLRFVPYHHVCTGDFIFIPASQQDEDAVAWMDRASCMLDDLDIQVSTGRIIDFRTRDLLVENQSEQTYPFIFSSHIQNGRVTHPLEKAKKPQWYEPHDDKSIKQLVPEGTYVLTKRFSSKEEKRRISAGIVTSQVPLGFDNKTNFFHVGGKPLDEDVAQGLVTWLNSGFVDRYFRVFSGHTQVNATDLRQMKFPTLKQLMSMGKLSHATDQQIEEIMKGASL